MIGVGIVNAWVKSAVALNGISNDSRTGRVIDGGAGRAAWKVPVTLSSNCQLTRVANTQLQCLTFDFLRRQAMQAVLTQRLLDVGLLSSALVSFALPAARGSLGVWESCIVYKETSMLCIWQCACRGTSETRNGHASSTKVGRWWVRRFSWTPIRTEHRRRYRGSRGTDRANGRHAHSIR